MLTLKKFKELTRELPEDALIMIDMADENLMADAIIGFSKPMGAVILHPTKKIEGMS